LLGLLRSIGIMPAAMVDPLHTTSSLLTVAAMAALGLSVDVRSVQKVGVRVGLAVIGSLAALITISLLLIKLLHLG